MKDGMAVARTGAACMVEVPPRNGSGCAWRESRVTDWCYQGVTDRSNRDEALAPGAERATRSPPAPSSAATAGTASYRPLLSSSFLCANSHSHGGRAGHGL
nr:hypothetical protein StreXyl84_46300 [Streptomyces sp. Xyl84]